MAIFKDTEKLTPRYIPSSLPHRDEEIQLMREKFSEVVPRRGAGYPRPVQVIGPVGIGKTSICINFGRALKNEAKQQKLNLTHVYVNLKAHGTSNFALLF